MKTKKVILIIALPILLAAAFFAASQTAPYKTFLTEKEFGIALPDTVKVLDIKKNEKYTDLAVHITMPETELKDFISSIGKADYHDPGDTAIYYEGHLNYWGLNKSQVAQCYEKMTGHNWFHLYFTGTITLDIFTCKPDNGAVSVYLMKN